MIDRADGSRRTSDNVEVCVFGGGMDTENLGVSALTESVIEGLARRIPSVRMTVFDHTMGIRRHHLVRGELDVEFEYCGARGSRRLYRFDSLWNIRTCARLGIRWNPASARILRSRAVLDISGGDSFTDLYGQERFSRIAAPKDIAIENGIPLILLPQTYGPFRSKQSRDHAARIVRQAHAAYARDERSYEALRELLGADFDAARHRSGVDVAFLLSASEPRRTMPSPIPKWLAPPRATPIVGLNVSGLILNDPDRATREFGFRADYGSLIDQLVARLLARTDAHILLIPHVLAPPGHYESDPGACEQVRGRVRDRDRGRVAIVPPQLDQCEMKWVISQCDWFCGTRMHSTIAALSTGVPTAAIAYSPKTLGVFQSCGQGPCVADPRALDVEDAVDQLWGAWERRDATMDSLRTRVPDVIAAAERQMDHIASICRDLPDRRRDT